MVLTKRSWYLSSRPDVSVIVRELALLLSFK